MVHGGGSTQYDEHGRLDRVYESDGTTVPSGYALLGYDRLSAGNFLDFSASDEGVALAENDLGIVATEEIGA